MIKNLLLAALILQLLLLLSACGSAAALSDQTPTDEATPSFVPPTRAPADERAKGDPNAPVTLIEYGDYQ
ncbi:MAG: hypothetical protein KJ077_46510 [Anaerolineae bacterium]|nr:hypothetical protein [Anaerolineae bacterium]